MTDEAVEIGDQPAAGGCETLAAEAEHVDVGLAPLQRLDQRAGVEIAGRPRRTRAGGGSLRVADAPAGFIRSADIRSSCSIGMRSKLAKPTPFELVDELVGVADQHDRQLRPAG